jgi:vacuolar protein sorting-associated protein 13A/C
VEKNRGRALISFAGKAILSDIHERNRRWTWAYFAERRDDRNAYVELFKKQMLNQLAAGGADLQRFDALERKLAYEDIRFYRSIARSQLRKDLAAKKKVAEERARTQAPASAQGTWGGWLWGSAAQSTAPSQAADDPVFDGTMTEAQKKELYDMLDYDEQSATTESINEPADALKARVVAKLNKGSLALQSEVAGKPTEIISVVFDVFQANVLQRQENLALALALGGLRVFDRTTDKTLYSQIVHMKGGDNGAPAATEEPLFALDFESKPLDARADMALSVRLKPTEIIYHRGYVEAVVAFFKPPESQLESVEALLVSFLKRTLFVR